MELIWTNQSVKPLLELDLQYFADGEGHPFAAEPAPVETHPFAEITVAHFLDLQINLILY